MQGKVPLPADEKSEVHTRAAPCLKPARHEITMHQRHIVTHGSRSALLGFHVHVCPCSHQEAHKFKIAVRGGIVKGGPPAVSVNESVEPRKNEAQSGNAAQTATATVSQKLLQGHSRSRVDEARFVQ
jgi:hypothetical protein